MTALRKFLDQPCRTCGAQQNVVNGAWLRDRRLRAGMTLRAFAEQRGVSAAYICDIEKNRRNCLPKMRDAYEHLASPETPE